jgi:hypothetical protein
VAPGPQSTFDPFVTGIGHARRACLRSDRIFAFLAICAFWPVKGLEFGEREIPYNPLSKSPAIDYMRGGGDPNNEGTRSSIVPLCRKPQRVIRFGARRLTWRMKSTDVSELSAEVRAGAHGLLPCMYRLPAGGSGTGEGAASASVSIAAATRGDMKVL